MLDTYVKREAADTHAEVPQAAKRGVATLLLVCAVAWALGHGYGGIVNDARLYTLQALAHLMPESLGQDVFLKFGSQDRYTAFSPLYAAVIRLVGTESAASTLTLAFQLSFALAAWLLARTILSVRLALFAVVILIAIPGWYGPGQMLKVMENFVTPRLPAEALGLVALATALRGKKWLSAACLIGAVLLHPIMAAAVAFAAFCLYVAIPHPKLAVVLAVSAVLVLMAGALLYPLGILRTFDPTWLGLVKERDPYVFISYWRIDDWTRAAIPLATLAVGWRMLPLSRGRALCQIALLTGVAGFGLTLLACDELHIVLLTELQPWRWEWLTVAIAALTLPLVISTCWQTDECGRGLALLLVSAWIFGPFGFALTCIAAAAAAVMAVHRLKPNEAHLVFVGACAVVIVALLWRVASNLDFSGALRDSPHTPALLLRVISFTRDGAAPIAVALLAVWLARRAHGGPALTALAIALLVTCTALVPVTRSRWTASQYRSSLHLSLVPWRKLIPPGTNVFWPDLPAAAWLLLDRPEYLSPMQTAGILFSREAAIEMKRRADVLSTAVPETAFLSWYDSGLESLRLSARQMALICKTTDVAFLVTSADLHLQPIAALPRSVWPVSNGLKLYRCSGHSG